MKIPAASALAAFLIGSTSLVRAQAPVPPAAAPAEKKPDAPEKPTAPEPRPEPPPEVAPKRPLPKLTPSTGKAGAGVPTRAAVDALSDAELDDVIAVLKENYINPDTLSDEELKRATVQGIIDRIAPGAGVVAAPAAGTVEPSPFRAEILDNRIGYARLGSTTADNLSELDATLQKLTEKKIGAFVLDLRATPPSSDFEQTAEVCRRFCPKGKVLFTVRKPNIKQEQILTSKDDPKFHGIIVVLVDRDLAGNGEIIAAVLRTHTRALVIGQSTKGEAVQFAEMPLAGGKLLRVAVAEVGLPENVKVFPGGVKPDIGVDVPQETTDEVLKRELEKGVSEFVFETERPRMNEAALVAGTNPELDAVQAAQKNRGERPKPPLRDAVLQRAVDFITTIAIYEKKPAAAK
jgi:hypothetical protein